MNSQNPWDVLEGAEPQQQPYKQVEEKFPELKAVPEENMQNPWMQLSSAPETGYEKAERVTGQLGSRTMEMLAAIPGEIELFARKFINLPETKKPYHNKEFEPVGKKVSEKTFFPTSQDYREKVKEIHGNKYEPRDQAEETAGNIVQKIVTAPGNWWMKLANAAGSEAAKEVAGALGASETTKALVDMGTSFAVSRFNAPTIRNYWNREYTLATRAIPNNATVPAGRIQQYLTAVRNRLNEGANPPWKDTVRRQLDALEENIQNGEIRVRAIDTAVHDLNNVAYSKGIDPNAAREINNLARGARRELRNYSQTNPVFREHWINANSAYAGWAANRRASQFMEKKAAQLTAGGGSSLLLTYLAKGADVTGKTVAAIASTYGITKASEFVQRVFANPVTRRYYMGAMLGAARENAPQLISNVNRLDRELKKEKDQSR